MVEESKEILGGPHNLPFMNYDMLKDLLKYENVKIITSTSIAAANDEGAIVKNSDGIEEILEADTVIMSIGYRSNKNLYDDLKMEIEDLYILGDAKQVKNIMYAIWDAYEVARSI
ncbi:FAD-dependent oxidoreductase [Clostridium sp. ZBS15]|uniref:FAD-dependent oxidoreductase n=1 Tax=Clostridium sp. ZBS15 TaxID=2949969 RepID=UPI00207A219B|nr:FAD-dependent oxidoreductase [Clostridium sp. ZBS15]